MRRQLSARPRNACSRYDFKHMGAVSSRAIRGDPSGAALKVLRASDIDPDIETLVASSKDRIAALEGSSPGPSNSSICETATLP